jgi:predicted TIM-barrel fold metal-dependent hydrolase
MGGRCRTAARHRTIEQAPFLSAEQKRDIFYNNAARFLRLAPEELRRHAQH